jgi:hypothetical protein
MHFKRFVRAILLGVVLCGGSILGVPMLPYEIEELMSCMNNTNVEVSVDQNESKDEMMKRILGQMR